MPPRRAPDPAELRVALDAVRPWIEGTVERPARPVVAAAVRASLRALERVAPGHAVEVRVPPFGAVQCLAGPRHTRGTPPHVVETDAATWLALALGHTGFADAVATGRVHASGHRAAEVGRRLPIVASTPSGEGA